MKRHNSRIFATLVLFDMDINNYDMSHLEGVVDSILEIQNEEEFEFDIPYAKKLIEGTLLNINTVDFLIGNALTNYTIDRLSYDDRAIIRLACYEMKFSDTPKNVIINEALEITKEYTNLDDDKQLKFNNKLLDNLAKVVYESRN